MGGDQASSPVEIRGKNNPLHVQPLQDCSIAFIEVTERGIVC